MPKKAPTTATFFSTAAELRAWLEPNHRTASELVVGFHKVATGTPSVTYPEALDEALCFGWIDGVRRSLGASSYLIRFTPRKTGSYWSEVNIRHAKRLIAAGKMSEHGLARYEERDETKTARYSNEARSQGLGPELEARFREHAQAWQRFESMAPSYRKVAAFWVTSAKQAATRERRFATLIECSARGAKVPPLTLPAERAATTPKKSTAKAKRKR